MSNKCHRGQNPFNLPMSATFATHEREGKWIAHSMEFDLASSGSTEAVALQKLRLSVKTYIEYGLSKGWREDIIFQAPDSFMQRLAPAKSAAMMEPITIDSRLMQVYVRTMSGSAAI